MDELNNDFTDQFVSVTKGVVGVCPLIGPLISEAVGAIIPNQRLDRVVEFLRKLDAEVTVLDARLEDFNRNLRTAEGMDLLEEGLVQASRSVSAERKERLARMVGRSLSSAELKYAESKKLLNLFRELTDPELLWLIYYSLRPTLNKGTHSLLMEKHPEVLEPIRRTIGSSQEQLDRGALQDSYKNTLIRLGLLAETEHSNHISILGEILVRYVGD